MDTQDKKNAAINSGVYLSNFVAMGISFFILVLAFAAGFFAKAYFGSPVPRVINGATGIEAQPDKTAVTLNQVKDVFNKAVIKFGDTKSKVVFVEISDPSCPFCGAASGKNGELNKLIDQQRGSNTFTLVKDGGTYEAPGEGMKKLVDEKKAAYALIYRNGHGNGEMAMKALYCAFDSGKFWEAHDLLMGGAGYDLINNTVKNDKGKTNELVAFLSSAVDQVTLKSCLDSGKYDARLTEDTKLGDILGISGTPGFFINDKKYAGAYNFTEMKPAIDEFLK